VQLGASKTEYTTSQVLCLLSIRGSSDSVSRSYRLIFSMGRRLFLAAASNGSTSPLGPLKLASSWPTPGVQVCYPTIPDHVRRRQPLTRRSLAFLAAGHPQQHDRFSTPVDGPMLHYMLPCGPPSLFPVPGSETIKAAKRLFLLLERVASVAYYRCGCKRPTLLVPD